MLSNSLNYVAIYVENLIMWKTLIC